MDDSSVFPFFRLPRELRDDIYKKTGGQRRSTGARFFQRSLEPAGKVEFVCATHISIHNHPTQSLQLVSKTFREEYEEEVWRDARLELAKCKSESNALSLLYPDADTGLLKSLANVPELDTRLKPPTKTTWRDYFNLWAKVNENAIRAILPYMPKCKRVFCDVAFNFPTWAQTDLEKAARGYATAPDIAPDLKMERRIFFAGNLYSMWEGYVPDEATLQMCPDANWTALREKVQQCKGNRVYYRARLDVGPDAIHGWRLDMITPFTAGVTLDMDAVFRNIGETRERRRRSLGRSPSPSLSR